MQKVVNLYRAVGVAGAYASINPIVSTPLGRKAQTNVNIGGFCWDDPDNDGYVLPSGEGKPLGFVARDVIYTIIDVTAEGQEFVPAGANVAVQPKGDFFVKVPAEVKKGDTVYVDTSTGAVAESGEDTGFVYDSNAAADEIAVIKCY